MSHAFISEAQAAALRVARDAGDKRAKKAVWSAIRADYGAAIPSGAKLGVEIDERDNPYYRVLYVKGSDPRRYIRTGASLGLDSIPPVTMGTSGRFVTVTPRSTTLAWASIDRDTLLTALRESVDDVDFTPDLPANFPANVTSENALVLDSNTGTLYFRA